MWYQLDEHFARLGQAVGAGLIVTAMVLSNLSARGTFGQSCPAMMPLESFNAVGGSPAVASDGDENWVVVWQFNSTGQDSDVYFVRSSDDALSWSDVLPLNDAANDGLSGDNQPQLAAGAANAWVVAWSSAFNVGGKIGNDNDILFVRSTDDGATWLEPAALNSNAAADGSVTDGSPQIVTDGKGNWVVVWFTLAFGNDLLYARSDDNAESWHPVGLLNPNAAFEPGYNYSPDVATDGKGLWTAVWHSSESLDGVFSTDYDILYTKSFDNGATWTAPGHFNLNYWSDSGDDQFVQIAAGGAGTWIVVWSSNDTLGGTIGDDFDILYARSTDDMETWSAPMPLNTNAPFDNLRDESPRLATDRAGNWVVVWDGDEDTGGSNQSYFSISSDTGESWSQPRALNPNLPPGTVNSGPTVATGSEGGWLAVWAGGFVNPAGELDAGVLYSRFFLPDCNANGVVDEQDIAQGASLDANSDGIPDECEVDVDADSINDICDNCALPNPDQIDCQLNGVGDECDLAGGTSQDCNGNSVPDECDITAEVSTDCNVVPLGHNCCEPQASSGCSDSQIASCVCLISFNWNCCLFEWTEYCASLVEAAGCGSCGEGNGIPDECELDCNLTGRPDACDIADGTSQDVDGNAIPDECQPPPCPADLDGDGLVGASDIAYILGAWGPNPGHPADFTGDGFIDAFDLALLLGAWGPCPP